MLFFSEQICFDSNIWVTVFLVALGVGLVDLLRWIFKLVFNYALSFALYIWQHERASNFCKNLVTAIVHMAIGALCAGLAQRWSAYTTREIFTTTGVVLHTSAQSVVCFNWPLLSAFPHATRENVTEAGVVLYTAAQSVGDFAFPHMTLLFTPVTVSLPVTSEILNFEEAFSSDECVIMHFEQDSTDDFEQDFEQDSTDEDFAKLSHILEMQLNGMRDACYSFTELKHVHNCMSTHMYKHILPKMEDKYKVVTSVFGEWFTLDEFFDLILSMVSQLQFQCSDSYTAFYNCQKFGYGQEEAVFACIRKNTKSILTELRQQYVEFHSVLHKCPKFRLGHEDQEDLFFACIDSERKHTKLRQQYVF
jgi:hypothetical protein